MSTQSGNAYVVEPAQPDDDPSTPDLLEVTFVADHTMVNLTPTLMAHAETLNGGIPGPIIRVKKEESFVVRLKNNMDHATGLHWHGIEMANKKDGTPFTQNDVPPGGTYLYKLHAPRAGLFWYHPHSHTSTNQTFRGMYGPIIVTDEDVEKALIDDPIGLGQPPIIPTAADTLALVLSDTTVCKQPDDANVIGDSSQNDTATYPIAAGWAWAGPGGVFPGQPGPMPKDICELKTLDDHGDPTNPVVPFQAGDIPNIQPKGPVMTGAGRVNEGQTVLTNGIQVEHRGGTHLAPDQQFSPTSSHPVTPGQGLRLQIFNCATTRYFRLHLSSPNFPLIPLFRIGGEGGLLEHPIQETDLKTVSIPAAFTQGDHLPRHSRDQRRGDDDRARRAECAHGPRDRPPRLRDGDGKDRAGGYDEGAAGERSDQEGVSGGVARE